MSSRPGLLLCLLLMGGVASAEEPVPEPVFAALDGHQVHVSEHLGHVVLLNFWSTWCGPCRTEMPVFVKLHQEFSPKGLHVIGASANARDEAEPVQRYMKQLGMSYEVWLWVSAKDMRYYGVGPGLPATVVLDRKGKVHARFQGVVNEAQLRPILESLLAEDPP